VKRPEQKWLRKHRSLDRNVQVADGRQVGTNRQLLVNGVTADLILAQRNLPVCRQNGSDAHVVIRVTNIAVG
jgi:hypothetical protein